MTAKQSAERTLEKSTAIRAEPGKQELITHEFDAPRELVFKAFTDPKLYVQWLLGPKSHGLRTKLDRFELLRRSYQ